MMVRAVLHAPASGPAPNLNASVGWILQYSIDLRIRPRFVGCRGRAVMHVRFHLPVFFFKCAAISAEFIYVCTHCPAVFRMRFRDRAGPLASRARDRTHRTRTRNDGERPTSRSGNLRRAAHKKTPQKKTKTKTKKARDAQCGLPFAPQQFFYQKLN